MGAVVLEKEITLIYGSPEMENLSNLRERH